MEFEQLLSMVKNAARVYLVGNGGSYANAAHLANDLLGCGVKAYTLDPASLTMLANDYGYEDVYALWIAAVGEPADLLIALSGSGKSPNIVRAVAAAEKIGMSVWTEYGYPRGMNMQEAEEAQLRLGHDLMRALKK